MRDFPIRTALTILLLALLVGGSRLASLNVKELKLASLLGSVEFIPDQVPVSPLRRRSEPVMLPASIVRLPAPNLLLNDSKGALDHFYRALWRTEKRESYAVTRITHYGDSPTTGDLITGDARSMLQSRFGNAGEGFVLIEKPWAWYQHRGVDLSGMGWLTVTAGHRGAEDGMFGLGGGSFTGSASASSRIVFHRARYSDIEVWFLKQPDGGRFTVSADGQVLGSVETSAEIKSPGFAAFSAEVPAREVVVQVEEGSVRLFGITAEKPGPGVVYDSLGLNGASIAVLARSFNAAHWAEELRHRRSDLVVVNYGTNEAGYSTYVDKGYEVELREAIRRVRVALPNSSVLIMSPMDRGQKAGTGAIETMPTIPRIVNIQRKIAEETGCAFFDTFDAMGGDGTMARWYTGDPRLVASDLIHPYGDGGKIVATLLIKELLAGLDRFKIQHSLQVPEVVMPKSPASKRLGLLPLNSTSLATAGIPSATPTPRAAASEPPSHRKDGSASAETRNQFRLFGKGAIVVVAEERSVAEELLAHPDNLRQLIQSGLLFAVNDGTPVEITETQGN